MRLPLLRRKRLRRELMDALHEEALTHNRDCQWCESYCGKLETGRSATLAELLLDL
jgi:hypothetical protein